MTEFITPEDAAQIAEILDQSVRDLGLLASAVGRPSASVFGEDAYPSLAEKIEGERVILGVAEGSIGLASLTAWVDEHLVPPIVPPTGATPAAT